MRRDKVYAIGVVCVVGWMVMTYVLFTHQPPIFETKFTRSHRNKIDHESFSRLNQNIDRFSDRLRKQMSESNDLLADLIKIVDTQKSRKQKEEVKAEKTVTERQEPENYVIPILMFACNRVSVTKAIDPLLKYRGQDPERKARFPIIVSQDCGHAETANKIRSYGDEIIFIQQPDQGEPQVPKAEKKFKGYFKIARHYGWALNQTFVGKFNYQQVIIVEDDLEVSPDFFEYFEATLPLLRRDPTLWCVSAWNDNGKKGLIDETRPDRLYRTDFFGGLGWMMTKDLWTKELMQKWPKSYWDDWMRQPAQRKNRACIRPEISRTKTFGKVGVSNGLFFDKHLKFIVLNDNPVAFLQKDLTYLLKDKYDKDMSKLLAKLESVPVQNLKSFAVEHQNSDSSENPISIKVIYKTKNEFKAAVKVLGIMDDFKSGVPRMAYKGVVSTFYRGIRVYLSPGLSWKNYIPTW